MLELKIGSADPAMHWMEFVSSLVNSLAWPIAVVVIAFLFRVHIGKLLAKIRKFSWGDASFELSEELDRVEDKARASEISAGASMPELALPDEGLQSLIALSPSAAILHMWAPVERRLQEIARKELRVDHSYRSGGSIALRLTKAGKLPKQEVEVIRDLQGIRNKAAHGDEVKPADAIRFHDLSRWVLALLERHN